jgi:hypothetical protein
MVALNRSCLLVSCLIAEIAAMGKGPLLRILLAAAVLQQTSVGKRTC